MTLLQWIGGEEGVPYHLLSGPVGDLVYLAGIVTLFRHFNCHVNSPRFCLRYGHPVVGTSYRACNKHHPHRTGSTSEADILKRHEETGL